MMEDEEFDDDEEEEEFDDDENCDRGKLNKNELKSILIRVLILFLLFALANGLMFGLLRPQDKYISVIGIVTVSGTRPCLYEKDKGVAVYYVDYVKYEYRFDSTINNGHWEDDKYLIRYKEGDPTKTRGQMYPFHMALIMYFELILLFIVCCWIGGLIKARLKKPSRIWTKQEMAAWTDEENKQALKRMDEANRKLDKQAKRGEIGIIITVLGFILILFGVMFASQPIYDNINQKYKKDIHNYSTETAQQLICEDDEYRGFISKNHNDAFYSIKPTTSGNYKIGIAQPLDFHLEVMNEDAAVMISESIPYYEKYRIYWTTVYLNAMQTYYIKLGYPWAYSVKHPVTIHIKGVKTI